MHSICTMWTVAGRVQEASGWRTVQGQCSRRIPEEDCAWRRSASGQSENVARHQWQTQ